ncbi:GAF domain-containing sensor histidine kinase [Neorhizobium sp. BETTINA12A]|uniref:GAF domain-containing sensor histidine kinase n=1 Tax=Neorhizobium sp. BETTINA12A TaxID=2908924 RepID=UPI001FF60FD8|nr:GAF domain-containing sensor histidine kinase [Neorhizobium sp. BETTINA12A]MCJ9749915.1 GAF domain-containing sensor histidine kinase [Neorhizobium sp. BETTINA12A]
MLNRARNALFDRYLGISRLLAGQLDFNAIIQAVAAEISHIIPHDHLDVCIKMVDGKYHIAYESGLATAWSQQPPALLTGSPIRTLLAGEVDFLLSPDACADPRFHFEGAFSSPIIALSLRSRLHVPLKVQGDIIGALSCSSHERDSYSMEDVENARSIADLLAPYFFALRAAEQAKRSAIVETEARAREEGLRLGALKLTEALEAERQRIGMDLHDQTLADLTRLSRRMERLSRLADMHGDALEPLCRTLQQCMHDLREIIEEAKPTVLQLFGVAEAIENHLERSVRESGQPIEWRMIDESDGALVDLDQTVATALFRIVQEAVNNAIRHGQPKTILVRLASRKRMLSIEVDDDGNGICSPQDKAGHGIDNMKTRSRLISARFEMAGHADRRGTSVKVTLPVGPKRLVEAST